MFWLAAVAFLWQAIQYLRTRKQDHLAFAAVAAYALAGGIRIMVQVQPRGYSIYYDSIIFLTFVFLLVSILQRVLRSLPQVAGRSLLFGLLAVEAAGLFATILPVPIPDYWLPAALQTDYGTIYTRRENAAVLRPAIAFMKEQRALGKHVLALPEEVPMYFFSGMEAPSRWYQLSPGILTPEDEDNYIAVLERIGIDFVLLSNRSHPEYDVPYFGLDFHQKIYQWIQDNYEVTGEFGHFIRQRGAPYAVLIYKRRSGATQ
jgi:hypothetical protein